jgi:hypothetical protein
MIGRGLAVDERVSDKVVSLRLVQKLSKSGIYTMDIRILYLIQYAIETLTSRKELMGGRGNSVLVRLAPELE